MVLFGKRRDTILAEEKNRIQQNFSYLQVQGLELQKQVQFLREEVEGYKDIILQLIHFYGIPTMKALEKHLPAKIEAENTLLIERLDKIEAHMALVAIKVPDMSEEEYVERKHVNGTSEHPAITTTAGAGGIRSSETGGTPTQDSVPAPAKARNTRSRATARAGH